MSGYDFLIASANGTCEKGVRRAVFTLSCHQFASPNTRYPDLTGIFSAAQFPPELTSRSTPSFFSSPVNRVLCHMPHCSHILPESFSGSSANPRRWATRRGFSPYISRRVVTTRRKKRVRISKGCPAKASEHVFEAERGTSGSGSHEFGESLQSRLPVNALWSAEM